MTATPSGADVLANTLITSLIADKTFDFPVIDLSDTIFDQPDATGPIFDPISKLTTEDLTTGVVNGSGVFDKLMASLSTHLKVEYQANRISGAEYTKAYIGIVQSALATSAQYLLGKDAAYWQALMIQQQARMAQIEVVKARVELEVSRMALVRAQYEAATTEVNYALTKMKLSTEDATYANLVTQKAGMEIDNTGKTYTVSTIMPQQNKLLIEQTQAQRAQTADTRNDDSSAIVGLMGKQKALYTQQITSYQRDSEVKAAKLWTDAWITQKTIDEGLLPPSQFQNTNVDEVLVNIRSGLSWGS